ncbi:MAG: hypothetical protein QOJ64_3761 [Acidobacteriota bacterium]|jgi:hypothetical protein|nr:hypothetical protein [Acidobacteriota bacterium]
MYSTWCWTVGIHSGVGGVIFSKLAPAPANGREVYTYFANRDEKVKEAVRLTLDRRNAVPGSELASIEM